MTCFKLTTTAVLVSAIFLFFKTGFSHKQAGTCRSVCTGSDCITVNQDRVDFKTAEERCRDRNGELMTLQPGTNESILDSLSQELFGDFWIGLRLPAGACSNLSAPLRGYVWTSVATHRSFIPSFSIWKDSVRICSPHCVSLSNDQKWTERLCSDKIDGYLCRTKHRDACQAQELSDPNIFLSSTGCSLGPCQHLCTDVRGGYKCSCFKGYISDSKDRRQCKLHCDEQKCPAVCEEPNDSSCFCPDGFIKNEGFCEDIDECLMGECGQRCKNTFGGFVCSCVKGFVLKDQFKCIKAEDSGSLDVTTPVTNGFAKPATKNETAVAPAAAGGFIWIWFLVAMAVVVLIFVVRFYVVKRQKRREHNSNQQSTGPAAGDNIEC